MYTDPHWCAYSSIVRSRGKKYTTRLENELNTINWIEQLAIDKKCDAVFCLGDFFDQSIIESETLTAIKDIRWNNLSHVFIVGNHEIGRADLSFSSAHVLALCPNVTIIDKPINYIVDENVQICFLPYMSNASELNLNSLFGENQYTRYVFSHNDIEGIQMGKFKSTSGIKLDDINCNCEIFFNGHLHNKTTIGKLRNIGNITGQNFSEDASVYNHCCLILDTNSGYVEEIENPFALNFYKLDLTNKSEESIYQIINKIKCNSIVSVTCNAFTSEYISNIIDSCSNILISRIIINRIEESTEADCACTDALDFSVDHLNAFKEFIINQLGSDQIIISELNEVLL